MEFDHLILKYFSEKVLDHKVKWNSDHAFICKISIDPRTNMLASTFIKITMKQVYFSHISYYNIQFVIMYKTNFNIKIDILFIYIRSLPPVDQLSYLIIYTYLC